MATPASRVLLSNAQVCVRLIRGSPSIRSVLGSFEDHRLPAPTEALGDLHFLEPPQVDLAALLGTRETVSLLRAGMSWPLFDTKTARSYCRGRREAEISDGESVEISDEEFDDDDDEMEDFYSDDEGDYDSDELMHKSDEEDEKPRKRK